MYDTFLLYVYFDTHHNLADSEPTSNLVCIKGVAIRTTFCMAGIIYYTCDLVTDIPCTRYKNAFNKRFFFLHELCVEITLLRSIPKKKKKIQ